MSLTFAARQPDLEPYALQQRWALPRPLAPAEWAAMFSEYLARLARMCTEAGGDTTSPRVVIGHIKLLALFDEGK